MIISPFIWIKIIIIIKTLIFFHLVILIIIIKYLLELRFKETETKVDDIKDFKSILNKILILKSKNLMKRKINLMILKRLHRKIK